MRSSQRKSGDISQTEEEQQCVERRTKLTVAIASMWTMPPGAGGVPERTLSFFHESQAGSEPGGELNVALMVAVEACGSQTRGDHCEEFSCEQP